MNIARRTMLIVASMLMAFTAWTQEAQNDEQKGYNHLSSRRGESTFGLGIGLPYGGIGVRFGVNVTDGLNLFGGLGYQIAGAGYNFGILKDFPSSSMTQFYLTAMYGTNAAVKVVELSEYNKVYTGPSFGIGVKVNSRKTEGNYWDVGLLVPIRSSEYNDVARALKNDPRIIDIQEPWPVLIVVGYNFNL